MNKRPRQILINVYGFLLVQFGSPRPRIRFCNSKTRRNCRFKVVSAIGWATGSAFKYLVMPALLKACGVSCFLVFVPFCRLVKPRTWQIKQVFCDWVLEFGKVATCSKFLYLQLCRDCISYRHSKFLPYPYYYKVL